MATDRFYDYDVNTSGIKEYRIHFTYASDADYAYDTAVDWIGTRRGIFDAFNGYDEIYVVCSNDTLHRFLASLEEDIEGLERDEEMLGC